MSHAQMFGKQNPGIDNFGVRLSVQRSDLQAACDRIGATP